MPPRRPFSSSLGSSSAPTEKKKKKKHDGPQHVRIKGFDGPSPNGDGGTPIQPSALGQIAGAVRGDDAGASARGSGPQTKEKPKKEKRSTRRTSLKKLTSLMGGGHGSRRGSESKKQPAPSAKSNEGIKEEDPPEDDHSRRSDGRLAQLESSEKSSSRQSDEEIIRAMMGQGPPPRFMKFMGLQQKGLRSSNRHSLHHQGQHHRQQQEQQQQEQHQQIENGGRPSGLEHQQPSPPNRHHPQQQQQQLQLQQRSQSHREMVPDLFNQSDTMLNTPSDSNSSSPPGSFHRSDGNITRNQRGPSKNNDNQGGVSRQQGGKAADQKPRRPRSKSRDATNELNMPNYLPQSMNEQMRREGRGGRKDQHRGSRSGNEKVVSPIPEDRQKETSGHSRREGGEERKDQQGPSKSSNFAVGTRYSVDSFNDNPPSPEDLQEVLSDQSRREGGGEMKDHRGRRNSNLVAGARYLHPLNGGQANSPMPEDLQKSMSEQPRREEGGERKDHQGRRKSSNLVAGTNNLQSFDNKQADSPAMRKVFQKAMSDEARRGGSGERKRGGSGERKDRQGRSKSSNFVAGTRYPDSPNDGQEKIPMAKDVQKSMSEQSRRDGGGERKDHQGRSKSSNFVAGTRYSNSFNGEQADSLTPNVLQQAMIKQRSRAWSGERKGKQGWSKSSNFIPETSCPDLFNDEQGNSPIHEDLQQAIEQSRRERGGEGEGKDHQSQSKSSNFVARTRYSDSSNEEQTGPPTSKDFQQAMNEQLRHEGGGKRKDHEGRANSSSFAAGSRYPDSFNDEQANYPMTKDLQQTMSEQARSRRGGEGKNPHGRSQSSNFVAGARYSDSFNGEQAAPPTPNDLQHAMSQQSRRDVGGNRKDQQDRSKSSHFIPETRHPDSFNDRQGNSPISEDLQQSMSKQPRRKGGGEGKDRHSRSKSSRTRHLDSFNGEQAAPLTPNDLHQVISEQSRREGRAERKDHQARSKSSNFISGTRHPDSPNDEQGIPPIREDLQQTMSEQPRSKGWGEGKDRHSRSNNTNFIAGARYSDSSNGEQAPPPMPNELQQTISEQSRREGRGERKDHQGRSKSSNFIPRTRYPDSFNDEQGISPIHKNLQQAVSEQPRRKEGRNGKDPHSRSKSSNVIARSRYSDHYNSEQAAPPLSKDVQQVMSEQLRREVGGEKKDHQDRPSSSNFAGGTSYPDSFNDEQVSSPIREDLPQAMSEQPRRSGGREGMDRHSRSKSSNFVAGSRYSDSSNDEQAASPTSKDLQQTMSEQSRREGGGERKDHQGRPNSSIFAAGTRYSDPFNDEQGNSSIPEDFQEAISEQPRRKWGAERKNRQSPSKSSNFVAGSRYSDSSNEEQAAPPTSKDLRQAMKGQSRRETGGERKGQQGQSNSSFAAGTKYTDSFHDKQAGSPTPKGLPEAISEQPRNEFEYVESPMPAACSTTKRAPEDDFSDIQHEDNSKLTRGSDKTGRSHSLHANLNHAKSALLSWEEEKTNNRSINITKNSSSKSNANNSSNKKAKRAARSKSPHPVTGFPDPSAAVKQQHQPEKKQQLKKKSSPGKQHQQQQQPADKQELKKKPITQIEPVECFVDEPSHPSKLSNRTSNNYDKSNSETSTSQSASSLGLIKMGSSDNKDGGSLPTKGSNALIETLDTLDSHHALKLQTAEELRELIDLMQAEFQRLRDAKASVEMKAEKLQNDLVSSQQEADGWRNVAQQERVQMEDLRSKADGLERENHEMKAQWRNDMREAEERCNLLEEENHRLKRETQQHLQEHMKTLLLQERSSDYISEEPTNRSRRPK